MPAAFGNYSIPLERGKRQTKIIGITLTKYRILCESLSEVKKKNDYRFVDTSWTIEVKIAWKRYLISLMVKWVSGNNVT